MPRLRVYKVFICHAWDRDEEYWRISNMLDAPNFEWENLSIPEHDRLQATTTDDLAKGLRDQMRPANVVIVSAGMWVAHRDWLDFEIKFARRIGIPIIAVPPWGHERLPVVLDRAASAFASRQDSLIAAIREVARFER
jgi:hypothetical protein